MSALLTGFYTSSFIATVVRLYLYLKCSLPPPLFECMGLLLYQTLFPFVPCILEKYEGWKREKKLALKYHSVVLLCVST